MWVRYTCIFISIWHWHMLGKWTMLLIGLIGLIWSEWVCKYCFSTVRLHQKKPVYSLLFMIVCMFCWRLVITPMLRLTSPRSINSPLRYFETMSSANILVLVCTDFSVQSRFRFWSLGSCGFMVLVPTSWYQGFGTRFFRGYLQISHCGTGSVPFQFQFCSKSGGT